METECFICTLDTPPLTTMPCNCKGSMGTVHQACLDEVIRRREDKRCPTCGKQLLIVVDVEIVNTPPVEPVERGSRSCVWIIIFLICSIIMSAIFVSVSDS